MDRASSFEDLVVWQKSHAVVLEIYHLTDSFPKSEQFGLTSQMRRAAYSIPSNIAEGFAKRGIKDKLRFYNISQGSIQELKYFTILSADLKYHDSKELLFNKINEVGKMLSGYVSKISSNS
ncbi:four helix bundle protein [Roseivirga sp. 4D4]|uniref:four helix bundle protein n=1 Tax=Roseivirga sp. 4D4 TaxID=1889784 RepID=UPI0008534E48|nr:four helix bundle protein [Roseivirga sp. 4D4]OEK02040.1 four helix bundle protein [Roseivirga sp. 4D4]